MTSLTDSPPYDIFFLVGFLSHTAPPEEKLSPDDAQFVDVIHSAGLWMGTDEKVYNIKYPSIVSNLFFSSIFVFFVKRLVKLIFTQMEVKPINRDVKMKMLWVFPAPMQELQ